jgi:hypothetical protein
VTRRRGGDALLIAGVVCFVAGALAVVLRAAGVEALDVGQTTTLAVFGIMFVGVGAALKHR